MTQEDSKAAQIQKEEEALIAFFTDYPPAEDGPDADEHFTTEEIAQRIATEAGDLTIGITGVIDHLKLNKYKSLALDLNTIVWLVKNTDAK